MKVENMTSNKGNKIANQFIVVEEGHGALGNFSKRETFQSYDSIIAIKTIWADKTEIKLDCKTWDYSITTGKYRNRFLGIDKKETLKQIKEGKIILANLN